jgi:hypothetical protein
MSRVRRTSEEIQEVYRKLFLYRSELQANNRSEDQNKHASPEHASADRWHRLGASQHMGVDSFSICARQIQCRAGIISRIVSLPRNVVWIAEIVPKLLGADKTSELERQTYERLPSRRQIEPNWEPLNFNYPHF